MPQLLTIRIPAQQYGLQDAIKDAVVDQHGINRKSITGCRVVKRSLDARSRTIYYQVQVAVYVDEVPESKQKFCPKDNDVTHAPKHAVIVGAGPAGLFAALQLIALGIKPIIIERGKQVRERRRDLAAINKEGIVNPESNYCFGEGGAGTYSDGKLYTRSDKRGDVQRVLEWLHHFGADESILIDAHPHIGTNKLPHIIEAMRQYIIARGGKIFFETKLTDLLLERGAVKGIVCNGHETILTKQVLLATGHSARDVFELLHAKGIYLEAKPFALGVRIEHPQNLIDNLQYHCHATAEAIMSKHLIRADYLPAASYALVSKKQVRSVYSFCMCPGGIIAPAATNAQEIVVNGWSPSKRNNPFANSGMVVAVDERDFYNAGYTGPLAGMYFQKEIEQKCYHSVAQGLAAPAINVSDFVAKRASGYLPKCSYLPGIRATDISAILPPFITESLRDALREFDAKMKGYISQEAVLVATESRTSSPVRIPRDKQSLTHPQVKGLYPCAEGAGYAGGIVSAAIDGMRCALAIGA